MSVMMVQTKCKLNNTKLFLKRFHIQSSEIGPLPARSGHMAQNKLHWDANYAVGLSKQRKVRLDWYEFLCFGSPTA